MPTPLLHAPLPLSFATRAVIRVRCHGHVFLQEFARRNHGLHKAEVARALDSLKACEAMLVATVPCPVVGVVVAPLSRGLLLSCTPPLRHGRAQSGLGCARDLLKLLGPQTGTRVIRIPCARARVDARRGLVNSIFCGQIIRTRTFAGSRLKDSFMRLQNCSASCCGVRASQSARPKVESCRPGK